MSSRHKLHAFDTLPLGSESHWRKHPLDEAEGNKLFSSSDEDMFPQSVAVGMWNSQYGMLLKVEG